MAVYHLLNIGNLTNSGHYPTSSNKTKKLVEAFKASQKNRILNKRRKIREECMANFHHSSFKASLPTTRLFTVKYILEKFLAEKEDKDAAPLSQTCSHPIRLIRQWTRLGGEVRTWRQPR